MSRPNDSSFVQLFAIRDISTASTVNDTSDSASALLPVPAQAIIATFLSIICLTTILGNLLVCVTIASVRRLHTATNFLIFSLSLSDLLLGLLVLPFSILNTIRPEDWPLGAIFCNLFISTDVTLCTVSILSLFSISLERYLAVVSPFRYQRVVSGRRVYLLLAGIWTFSLLMSFPPIHIGWNTPDGSVQNLAMPSLCVFELNVPYVLLVATSTYFVPLIIMCCVYIKVLTVAREQVKQINQLVRSTMVVLHQSTPDSDSSNQASDSKATVTLASVVLAFVICWVPYFTVFTVKPFLSSNRIPLSVELVTLWLGYLNSMLNPFLYAFHSKQFRQGFLHVLCARPFESPSFL